MNRLRETVERIMDDVFKKRGIQTDGMTFEEKAALFQKIYKTTQPTPIILPVLKVLLDILQHPL